jgi:hypothetical protein
MVSFIDQLLAPLQSALASCEKVPEPFRKIRK